MINSLHVQNFQSHKDSWLEFEPGVNVIIGPSDSGKTALFRALTWVLTNRPTGTAFRSRWGGETRVAVDLSEDLAVIRTRGKGSLNMYELLSVQEDGEPLEVSFKAVGTTVPKEVLAVLNMNDINIQRQLDAPFLLSDSPGEVAKRLQELANLETIDRSFSRVNAMIRAETQSEKFHVANIESMEQELTGYVKLDEWETEVAALEALETKAEQLRMKQGDINRMGKKIVAARQKVKRFQTVSKHDAELKELEELQAKLQETRDAVDELDSVIVDIERKDKSRERWTKKLRMAQADFKELMPNECPLCGQEVFQ